MTKFRKLGLISYNGHIEVNSARLDAVLRDKPPHLAHSGEGDHGFRRMATT
jgi:hypothetical protein